MAMPPTTRSLVRDLIGCRVAPKDLPFGEFTFQLKLKRLSSKSGKTEQYEIDGCFGTIVSALMNSSGGIIIILPPDLETALDVNLFEILRNNLHDRLKFLTPSDYQKCISTHVQDGHTYVLVHKSKTFSTANAHMYTRIQVGTTGVYHYQHIAQLVSQRSGSTDPPIIPITGPFLYMNECAEIERTNLEFKSYRCEGVPGLIDRLRKCRGLSSLFGMANIPGGGDIVLGIKEDELTHTNIFVGQEADEHEEDIIREEINRLISENENGNKRLWGHTGSVPLEGTHWTCKFIPMGRPPYVCNDNEVYRGKRRCPKCPHKKRRVLIVIHVSHCAGGMFAQKPEAFTVNDDGYIEEVSFMEWQVFHLQYTTIAKARTMTHPSPKAIRAPRRLSHSQRQQFKDNTSISYREHSPMWDSTKVTQADGNVLDMSETGDLFRMEFPVRFIPSRASIERVLSGKKVLTLIDQQVKHPACGIAASSLFECVAHGLSPVPTGPPDHVMDMLVVNEMACIFLFIICTVYDQHSDSSVHEQYVRVLARVLKRCVLESMTKEGDYAAVNVQWTIVSIDGFKVESSTLYHSWFHQPISDNQHHLICVSLARVLSGTDTLFKEMVTQDVELQLSRQQMEALLGLDPNKFNFIEGPPGCGKTILAQHICETKGRQLSAYISASKPLNNRIEAVDKIDVYYAKTSDDVAQLLQRELKEKRYIVIDDNHVYTYSGDAAHEICSYIARSDKYVYMFQDSIYQNYITDPEYSDMHQFVIRNRYGSCSFKTLTEIRRNSLVVGSFLEAQVSSLLSSARSNEVRCVSRVAGENIHIRQLADLRTDGEHNGLLKHVKSILSTSVDCRQRHYTTKDIAILIDHKNSHIALKDIDFFRHIFREYWQSVVVQNAETYPVEGIIIDQLHTFVGLESRVVIFVMPTEHRFSQDDEQSRVMYTRYLIAIASRAIERVDFVQEGNLDSKIANEMTCNKYPAELLEDTKDDIAKEEDTRSSMPLGAVGGVAANHADGMATVVPTIATAQSTSLGRDSYQFDAFVCYNREQLPFVKDDILVNLEEHAGIRLCIHDRDWILGADILDNMIHSIDSSRKVIFIVSNSFAISQWCNMEMNITYHRCVDDDTNKIILLLYEDVPPKDLPTITSVLMKTSPSFRWRDDKAAEAKFWKNLITKIVEPSPSFMHGTRKKKDLCLLQ